MAAVLSLLLGTQAMAAGASQYGNIAVEQTKVEITVNGETVEVVPVIQASEKEITVEQAKEFLQTSNDVEVNMFDASLVSTTSNETVKLSDGSVTLTFKVPNVTANSNVVVKHWTETGEEETLTPVLGEGTVTVTFTSLSPVAIIVEKAENDKEPDEEEKEQNKEPDKEDDKKDETTSSESNSGSSSGSVSNTTPTAPAPTAPAQTAVVSPKTAETNMIVYVEAAVVIAFLGMVTCAKKNRV